MPTEGIAKISAMSRKKPRNQGFAGAGQKVEKQEPLPHQRKSRKHDKLRKTSTSNPISIPKVLIILAYILVTTFTPNLMSLDTNAPKFTALALLNLLSFIYLVADGDMRRHPGYFASFFTTRTGLAYTGLLLLSLLSFTQAINLLESVINFSKLFTIFSATFILAVLFTRDLRLIRLMAIFYTGVLLFDSFSVFYYIREFIQGNIARIHDIKSVYSNKNILASALFIKIPFALWLMVYEKGWLKRVAWLAVMTGITATFFMIARTFYVGLIIVTLLFTAYTLTNYFRDREKRHLRLLGSYLGALILALAIHTYTQSNHYPGARPGRTQTTETAPRGRQTGDVVQQITSITMEGGSERVRLNAWKYSLLMIRANPLLGVGPGNWKVNVLQHENQKNPGFIYLFKAHNDFLETTTETGIVGGLLYTAIYIFVGWAFLMAYFHRRRSEALYKYLFLAASGLVFFSFDALFNFPHDRPEIMILFAGFVATGISASYYLARANAVRDDSNEAGDEYKQQIAVRSEMLPEGPDAGAISAGLPVTKPWMMLTGKILAVTFMIPVIWVLYTNFQSTITQRIAYQEIMRGELKSPPEKITEGLPVLPNLSIWGESLRVLQARYLINEEKYEEAIEMIRDDRSNPWDSRREFFTAMAYNRMGNNDSTLKYVLKAYDLKPFHLNTMLLAIDALEKAGEYDRVEEVLDRYLAVHKREANAWIAATNFYNRRGNLDKAVELIDEAIERLPRSERVQQQHTALHHQKYVAPYIHLYETAADHYRAGRYQPAIRNLNEFMEYVPDHYNAFRLRAFCHYHTQAHQQCIDDVNRAFELGDRDPSILNLRGVSFRALGDMEAACRDFEESKNAGNPSGTQNFSRFCMEQTETAPVESILRMVSPPD